MKEERRYLWTSSSGTRNDRPTRIDYDGALSELQAVQDFAVRHLQGNDPRGRTVAELAPLSLPVLSHP